MSHLIWVMWVQATVDLNRNGPAFISRRLMRTLCCLKAKTADESTFPANSTLTFSHLHLKELKAVHKWDNMWLEVCVPFETESAAWKCCVAVLKEWFTKKYISVFIYSTSCHSKPIMLLYFPWEERCSSSCSSCPCRYIIDHVCQAPNRTTTMKTWTCRSLTIFICSSRIQLFIAYSI